MQAKFILKSTKTSKLKIRFITDFAVTIETRLLFRLLTIYNLGTIFRISVEWRILCRLRIFVFFITFVDRHAFCQKTLLFVTEGVVPRNFRKADSAVQALNGVFCAIYISIILHVSPFS